MIDPTTQLAALIRAQLGAQTQTQAQARTQARNQPDPAQAAGSRRAREEQGESGRSPSSDDAQLHRAVVSRIGILSPDDPQRQRKAFRMFLESVLMQEFGRGRLGENGFDQMVDTVLERMESDAGLSAAMQEAGRLLLAEAAPHRGEGSNT